MQSSPTSVVGRESFYSLLKYYRQSKVPYIVHRTKRTAKVFLDGELRHRYVDNTHGQLPKKEMGFLRQVGKYIRENIPTMPKNTFSSPEEYEAIKYYDHTGTYPGMDFDAVIEIDLNHAYWVAAYQLGIIPKRIFDKGESVGKVTRLAALGSLAKHTLIYEFDGERERYIDTIRDENTEYLWFMICKRVADVMQKAKELLEKDFFFYWVDGIYMDKYSDVSEVIEYFNSEGFQCKQTTHAYLRADENFVYLPPKGISNQLRRFPINPIRNINDIAGLQ